MPSSATWRAIETLQAGLPGQKLAGVGVGVPGFILMDKGIVVGAPNLPEFDNYPVRDEIEKRLGAKVILENDANAAALGEKWMGAGRDVNDLICSRSVPASGAGIISNGRFCAVPWVGLAKSATSPLVRTTTCAAAGTPVAPKIRLSKPLFRNGAPDESGP